MLRCCRLLVADHQPSSGTAMAGAGFEPLLRLLPRRCRASLLELHLGSMPCLFMGEAANNTTLPIGGGVEHLLHRLTLEAEQIVLGEVRQEEEASHRKSKPLAPARILEHNLPQVLLCRRLARAEAEDQLGRNRQRLCASDCEPVRVGVRRVAFLERILWKPGGVPAIVEKLRGLLLRGRQVGCRRRARAHF